MSAARCFFNSVLSLDQLFGVDMAQNFKAFMMNPYWALYQQTHSVNRNIRAILTSTSSDWKPLLTEQLPGPNGRFNSVRFETVVQTTMRLKHPIQCYIYIYVYMYTVAANQTMARAEVPRINSHHEPWTYVRARAHNGWKQSAALVVLLFDALSIVLENITKKKNIRQVQLLEPNVLTFHRVPQSTTHFEFYRSIFFLSFSFGIWLVGLCGGALIFLGHRLLSVINKKSKWLITTKRCILRFQIQH